MSPPPLAPPASSRLSSFVIRHSSLAVLLLLAVGWGCERGNNASPPPDAKTGKEAVAKGPAPHGAAPASLAEEEKTLLARLANHPDDADSRLELANLYFDTHRSELAIAAYREVLKARPDDPDVRTDLGTCYRQLDQFDKAAAEYERVLKAHPKHVNATYNLAVVCHLAGDNARAASLWEKAAALAPGTPLGEAAARYAVAARLGQPIDKTASDAIQGPAERECSENDE